MKLLLAVAIYAASILLSLILGPKKQPQKGDGPKNPTADYGVGINRVFGTMEVATIIVWAPNPALKKNDGKGAFGGSGGKQKNDEYFGDFHAVIGEGVRAWNDQIPGAQANAGQLVLEQILLNDAVWVNLVNPSSKQSRLNSERAKYYTFYSGTLTQTASAAMIAREGANKATGYQGYSYLEFINLPLHENFGGQFPTVKVKVRCPTLDPTLEVITKDLFYRAGGGVGKGLREDIDYLIQNNSNITNIALDGFVIEQGGNQMLDVLGDISQIFGFQLCQNNRFTTSPGPCRIQPTHNIKPRIRENHTTFTSKSAFLGANKPTDGILSPPLSLEQQDPIEIPYRINVRFYNKDKAYEQDAVYVERATPGWAEARSITTMAALSPASAEKVGRYALNQGYSLATLGKLLTGGQSVIRPGDYQSFTGVAGDYLVAGLVQKVSVGEDGRTEVEIIPDSISVTDLVVVDNDIAFTKVPPDSILGALPQLIWFEGPYIAGLNIQGAPNTLPTTSTPQKSINVLLAPQEGFVVDTSALVYSTDNGSTYFDGNLSLPKNSVLATIDNFNAAPKETNPYLIDEISTIDITVPTGLALSSIGDPELLSFNRNFCFIDGVGLFTFATATLLAANQYRLSRFIFDIKQNYFDFNFTPTTSTIWILTAAPYSWTVPAGIPTGANLTINATVKTGDLGDAYTNLFDDENQKPRPTTAHRSRVRPNGDIELRWDSGFEIGVTNLGTLTPLFSSTIRTSGGVGKFRIKIYNNNVVVQTQDITTNSFVYTAAQQAIDGVTDLNNLTFSAQEYNGHGYINDNQDFRSVTALLPKL